MNGLRTGTGMGRLWRWDAGLSSGRGGMRELDRWTRTLLAYPRRSGRVGGGWGRQSMEALRGLELRGLRLRLLRLRLRLSRGMMLMLGILAGQLVHVVHHGFEEVV